MLNRIDKDFCCTTIQLKKPVESTKDKAKVMRLIHKQGKNLTNWNAASMGLDIAALIDAQNTAMKVYEDIRNVSGTRGGAQTTQIVDRIGIVRYSLVQMVADSDSVAETSREAAGSSAKEPETDNAGDGTNSAPASRGTCSLVLNS